MTEFQYGTFLTVEAMGCQMHTIGKAIRPLFADLVTYVTRPVKTGHVGTQNLTTFSKCHESQLFVMMCYCYDIFNTYLTGYIRQITEWKYSVPLLRYDLLCDKV